MVGRKKLPAKKKTERASRQLANIKKEIESGSLKTLEQLYDIMGISLFATAVGISFNSLDLKTRKPDNFRVSDIKKIARSLKADELKVAAFIMGLKVSTAPQKKQ